MLTCEGVRGAKRGSTIGNKSRYCEVIDTLFLLLFAPCQPYFLEYFSIALGSASDAQGNESHILANSLDTSPVSFTKSSLSSNTRP